MDDPGSLSVLVDTLKIDSQADCDQSSVVKGLYETRGTSEATAKSNAVALPDVHDKQQVVLSECPTTPDSFVGAHLCPCHHFASPPVHELDVCTPKGSVFDSIAPPPYALLRYPQCSRCTQEDDSPFSVVRSLHFDSVASLFDNAAQMDAEEEYLFQTIYGTVVEEIILMHTQGLRVSFGFKTPASVSLLSGVAETCPQHPVKPSRKFREIDKRLCKKLEF